MNKHGMAAAVAMGATIVLSALPAWADGDYQSPTEDRVRVSLGVMRVANTTDLRLDPSAGGTLGTYLRAEDTFGLDRSDVEPEFQAVVRAAERHRLFVDYFSLNRTGNAGIGAQPIAFRDVTLLPGDPVQSKLDLRMLGLTYGYSFWHTQRLEVAGTFGIIDTDISTQVKVQTATRHIFQSEDEAGPVPALGVDATWVLSKRFYLDARVQYLEARVSGITGSIGRYEFDALYRLRPNISFALGYTDLKAYVDKIEGSKTGRFDLRTAGPQFFVRVAF